MSDFDTAQLRADLRKNLIEVGYRVQDLSSERQIMALGAIAADILGLEHLIDDLSDRDQLEDDAQRLRVKIATAFCLKLDLRQIDIRKNPASVVAGILRKCPLLVDETDIDCELVSLVNVPALSAGDEVDEAAATLRVLGRGVTVRAVREILGSGSHRDLLERVRHNKRRFGEGED